jgi:hypothetical protein
MDMKMQSTKKNLLVYIIESLEQDNLEVNSILINYNLIVLVKYQY